MAEYSRAGDYVIVNLEDNATYSLIIDSTKCSNHNSVICGGLDICSGKNRVMLMMGPRTVNELIVVLTK